MNYLAHLYLSGESEDLRFGNFIADSIRGKELARYQDGVLQGIMMHRAIDFYTDSHTTVNKSVARLKPGFKRYAPVIIDVFYDTILPLNGLIVCLFVVYRWKKHSLNVELEQGDHGFKGSWQERYLDFSLRTFIPVILLLVFINTVAMKYFNLNLLG